jgi:hypothetical protein
MQYMGAAVIATVVLFFSFRALDGYGLPESSMEGTVLGKEYRPVSEQLIRNGNRTHTTLKPEAFVLSVGIEDRTAEFEIDREEFHAAAEGEKVLVRFAEHRLTGNVRILDLSGLGDGD